MAIKISPLSETDIPGAIEAIQKAFAEDPYNLWVFNDRTKVCLPKFHIPITGLLILRRQKAVALVGPVKSVKLLDASRQHQSSEVQIRSDPSSFRYMHSRQRSATNGWWKWPIANARFSSPSYATLFRLAFDVGGEWITLSSTSPKTCCPMIKTG